MGALWQPPSWLTVSDFLWREKKEETSEVEASTGGVGRSVGRLGETFRAEISARSFSPRDILVKPLSFGDKVRTNWCDWKDKNDGSDGGRRSAVMSADLRSSSNKASAVYSQGLCWGNTLSFHLYYFFSRRFSFYSSILARPAFTVQSWDDRKSARDVYSHDFKDLCSSPFRLLLPLRLQALQRQGTRGPSSGR